MLKLLVYNTIFVMGVVSLKKCSISSVNLDQSIRELLKGEKNLGFLRKNPNILVCKIDNFDLKA